MLRWHSGTPKCGGRTKQRDQIDNEARLFWKGIVKTKYQCLTSLAFIRLVPGADRAVRHICIRCMRCRKVKMSTCQLAGNVLVFLAQEKSAIREWQHRDLNACLRSLVCTRMCSIAGSHWHVFFKC